MGMSRRAKRGIAVFNKIQNSPNNQKYHSTRMEIRVGPQPMAKNILSAALAAAEAIHATVQIVSKGEDNPIAPEQEGGAQLSVPVQPEAGKTAEEGTPGGAQ